MSRKPTRAYVGGNTVQQVKPFLMRRFEIRLIAVDLRTLCGLKGVTLSSAVWDTDYTEITLGVGTLTGNIAQTTIFADKAGPYWGTVLATLSNGEKVKRTWAVFVDQGSGVTGADDPAFSIGEVEFSFPTYEVEVDDESALITVVRNGGSDGAASVHYATSDGTATAGVDYTAVSGTLTWADGDYSDKTFEVPILSYDDGGTVILTLSDPQTVTIGNVNPATLTIPFETTTTIYDIPGTYPWEIDPLATSVEVRVLGAGGGGGGGVGGSGSANIVSGGGGGGGGAGAVQTFTPEELQGTFTIIVGAGGAGGAKGLGGGGGTYGQPGEPGGASSFGSLIVAGGGGGGGAGEWAGAPMVIGGGGGGGVQSGLIDPSATGGMGVRHLGGSAGTVGGAVGAADSASSEIAEDAPNPTTDYGGGGGGAGDFTGSRGSVSLWGGPGGGGGSAALNGLPVNEIAGASGTPSQGATDIPAGGAPHSDGADGVDPTDPLMLAGSSGGGGGGGVGSSGFSPNNGGNGGRGGRGAGGGGGGGIYVGDTSAQDGGNGGTGGDGYVVIIQSFV